MKKSIFHYALSSLLVGGIALSVTSCADDDINPNQGNDGDALVRFSINDVQEQAVSRGLEMTRGAIANGITTADLAGHKLAAHSNRNIDVCFIETTVEGVNPIKADAATRAKIKTNIDDDFSSTGIRGAASILTTPEWFHAEKTKSNGELYNPIRWSMAEPNARFFAVYPSKEKYSSMTINNTATAGSPNVDFTVKSNVADQVDLMTACTGDVHYATQGEHPTTNLNFRHALTAIRFAVGQNLSWNKTIDKVEIRNAVMASKYTLSQRLDGVGADWDHTTDTRGTATLSGVSVSTSRNPNATIMGNAGDNYTFYMIPQVLTSNNVSIYVHCTDGTEITAPLKGEWKAGTTRTYKLSETNSNWTYTLTATDPKLPANYNETTSLPFGVQSFREDPGTHTKQAVPWKVIGYSVDGGITYTTNKPSWLTALSIETGNGGTAGEQGTATLSAADIKDLLKERNDGLKAATPLGTASRYYDLSTAGGTVARSTANSYVISAPGYYRIPLVYGNAITGGATNSSAYISSAPVTIVGGADVILHNFKDHNGNNITNPWIEKSNAANTNIDGAHIVWADEANLIHLSSTPIVHEGANNDAYLQFEVKASDIKSGNAVVAVTKGNTVVWSWHLWFAPQSALTPIEVTNHQNKKYNFTEETLGWKPTEWLATTYNAPRTVKVKVEQEYGPSGNKKIAVFNITQNPGGKKASIATFYQFGRKDAIPGTDALAAASTYSFDNTAGGRSLGYAIQHPENMFGNVGTGYNSADWCNTTYYNLWSVDNTTVGFKDEAVIKTIYDPSPAGYKMPTSNVFTGFTIDGENGTTINHDDTYNNGHNFWTNSNKNEIVFLPAVGCRRISDGLFSVGGFGYYWSAIPKSTDSGCYMYFNGGFVFPLSLNGRADAFAVRPVTE